MSKENVKNLKNKDAKVEELEVSQNMETLESDAELSVDDLDEVAGGITDEELELRHLKFLSGTMR